MGLEATYALSHPRSRPCESSSAPNPMLRRFGVGATPGVADIALAGVGATAHGLQAVISFEVMV